jgi:hypothetical protein
MVPLLRLRQINHSGEKGPMKYRAHFISTFWIILVFVWAIPAWAAIGFSVQPPESFVALGDTVELAVHVDGPDSVGWYWVEVHVDDTVLEFLDCSTDIMGECPSGSWCPECGPTEDPGVVSICCACFGTHTCVGIPADVAVIRYVVTGIGISTVVLEETHASDCDREMITVGSVSDGVVMTQGATVERGPSESSFPIVSCYPNPFVASITLHCSFPPRSKGTGAPMEIAEIQIFDIRGRQIRRLEVGHGSGEQRVVWDGLDQKGRPVPSGTYFCRMEVGGRIAVQKMLKLE